MTFRGIFETFFGVVFYKSDKFDSLNRTVYASAQERLDLHSARSWLRHSHASFRQIGGGGLCFAKPLYAAANFVNSRNVICHFAKLG